MNASRRGLVLFLDWDETISAHDTLDLIAPPEGEQKRGPPFSAYGKAYMDDLAAYDRAWTPSASPAACDVRDELGDDWRNEWAYLKGVDATELVSQRRIEAGGLFEGADVEAMLQRTQRVRLQTGWQGFVERELEGQEWHVVSVGWSVRFINRALQSCTKRNGPTSICANEIQVDGQRATGLLTKSNEVGVEEGDVGTFGMRTVEHKVREMRRILATRAQKAEDKDGAAPVTMYFGDSATDIGCLLAASVGVIMGEKRSLQSTLERAQLIRFVHRASVGNDEAKGRLIESVRQHMQTVLHPTSGDQPAPFLIRVRDWDEASVIVNAVRATLSS